MKAKKRGEVRWVRVANVYDVQKVLRMDFEARLGALPADSLSRVADGLRLVLELP